MKKLITIAALIAVSCISKANHLNSVLSIQNFDNPYITVSLDQPYFSQPSNQVVLDDVTSGNHFLQVQRLVRHPMHPWYQTIFRGYVFINPSSNIVAAITRNHQFRVLEVSPLFPAPIVYEPQYNPEPCNNYQPSNYAVSDYDFDMMRKNIDNRSFESTRLQLAKQFIDNNYFSARQIAELMRLMTFESTKLELAKYAYSKTIDRNKYFIVNDEFTFESSISELSDYISHQG